ncbi:glycosyltransferase family 2 protein [Candidatus Woesearchaeota archaeon]|nr:glycosyltransferase family 2 protein [Candidatus Woesearchaeota archaeon]
MRHSLSVIVACYNEEKNIAGTLKRISKAVPYAEIIAVDDGSADNTSEAAKKTGIKNLRVIRYRQNMGKGYAIRKGVDAAKGAVQAQVDADSQFPPEELPRLIKPILDNNADVVFASRFVKGSTIQKGSLTKMRRLANFVVSGFTSILAGKRFTDVNAGFKAWKTDAIRDIDFRCRHFAYEPEIAIKGIDKGYRFVEVPVNYKGRQKGISNVKLLRDGVIIPLYLLRLKLSLVKKRIFG